MCGGGQGVNSKRESCPPVRTPKSSLPSPESVLAPRCSSQMSWGLQGGNAGPGRRSQWELRLKGPPGNDRAEWGRVELWYRDAKTAGRRREGRGGRARTRPRDLGVLRHEAGWLGVRQAGLH